MDEAEFLTVYEKECLSLYQTISDVDAKYWRESEGNWLSKSWYRCINAEERVQLCVHQSRVWVSFADYLIAVAHPLIVPDALLEVRELSLQLLEQYKQNALDPVVEDLIRWPLWGDHTPETMVAALIPSVQQMPLAREVSTFSNSAC